jgi:hypothetical protein
MCCQELVPTPFVVIAHGRSGSTMLSLALDAHPNVAMFLELFHRDPMNRQRFFRADGRRWSATRQQTIVRRNARVYQESEDPATFLAESVFYRGHPKHIRAIGFKLLHNFSVIGAAEEGLWRYIESNRALRVILLRRQDLASAFVSHEIARRSGKWTYFRCPKSPTKLPPPFEADLEHFMLFARKLMINQQLIQKRLKGRKVLDLTYERHLGATFDNTCKRVQKFLDIPVYRLPILTKKTPSRPLENQILNLKALQESEAKLRSWIS